MKNVLIIGAHYDDAELGAGGTAAKLVAKGCNVYKITLTDNETDFKQMGIKVKSESSVEQSAAACKILGVKEITEFKPAPCNQLEYGTEMMQQIESYIYKLDIDTVIMHFRDDMNHDHIEAHKLCLTAARHCKNILEYQSNIYTISETFYPTYFVDITDFIEKKKAALNSYGTEHNRFGKLFETNIARNFVWGGSNHTGYAEGFNIIKLLD